MATQRAVAELILSSQFSDLAERAEGSPRRRTVHCFHQEHDDNPHRFLNVILSGSYVAPHRHREPPKAESFVVLQGELGVVLFHDDGTIADIHHLRALTSPREAEPATACGIDLLPGCWHTIVALAPVTVIFEVKPGPYDGATDKEFAPWAPAEGNPGAAEYLRWLEAECRQT